MPYSLKSRRDHAQRAFWRNQVLERDEYRCLSCGSTSSIYVLQLLKTFNIDDGVTLCTKCKNYLQSSEDFEWIARCMIMDQKFKMKEK